MKNPSHVVLFVTAVWLSGCGQAARTEQAVGFGDNAVESSEALHEECLDAADAEKILGQPVELKETSSEKKSSSMQFKCTYAATAMDPKTNALGALFYHFEKFETSEDAHKEFKDIVSLNKGESGQSMLSGIGDEAWYHSDDQNFYLLIARKGVSVVRIKVNKVTSFTSSDQLKEVVKALAAKM